MWPILAIKRNEGKNKELKSEGRPTFAEVEKAFSDGKFFAVIKNPQSHRNHQFFIILILREYTHVVPFVVEKGVMFLKTIYASRKYHKIYFIDKK